MKDDESQYLKQDQKHNLHILSDNKTSMMLLDWHVLEGGFRTSAGFAFRHHQLNFDFEPVSIIYKNPTITNAMGESGLAVKNALLSSLVNVESKYPNRVDVAYFDEARIRLQASSVDMRVDNFLQEGVDGFSVKIGKENINVVGDVQFQKTSPYLGFGWGTPPESKSLTRFSVDIGAIYQKRPNINYLLAGDIPQAYQEHKSDRYEKYLSKQMLEAQRSLEQYKLMPYLSLSLVMRF